MTRVLTRNSHELNLHLLARMWSATFIKRTFLHQYDQEEHKMAFNFVAKLLFSVPVRFLHGSFTLPSGEMGCQSIIYQRKYHINLIT